MWFLFLYILGFSASRVPAEGALGLNAAPEDGEEEEEEEEEKDGELTEEARARRTRREAHWRSMFNIRLQDNRERKYESELLLEAAENLGGLLREQVTLPPDRGGCHESLDRYPSRRPSPGGDVCFQWVHLVRGGRSNQRREDTAVPRASVGPGTARARADVASPIGLSKA